MVHLTLTGLWRKKCSELLHNTFLCHGALPLPLYSTAHLPQSPASPAPLEKPVPGLAHLTAGVCQRVRSAVPYLHTQFTPHTAWAGWGGALNAPHRCQQETKTKRIQARRIATFFFRSRDRLRCFLFFSVSSSALISKSLFFFNCEAA